MFIPSWAGSRALGVVKTMPLFSPYAQVAFMSNNSISEMPIMEHLIQQLNDQQTPDLLSLGLINRVNYSSSKVRKETLESWAVVGNHLRQPGSPTAAVFHIGSWSAVCSYLDRLIETLMTYVRKLKLPIRDSTIIQAFYFKQMEEVVKDTFRFVAGISCVKETLCLGSHIPLYHSDYLLPRSKLPAMFIKSMEDGTDSGKLFQILQKVFLSQLNTYVSQLHGYKQSESSSSGHFHSWRFQSTAVATVDISTNRSKLKKSTPAMESNPLGDESTVNTNLTAESVPDLKDTTFSAGFLDRMQWKRLRELALDTSIVYLVIITEKPILSYKYLPHEFVPPISLDKGEIIPWSPTVGDLDVFFKFWMEWLGQYQKGLVPCSRNLMLVSTSEVPYGTVIQDMQSGLKINQVCMANALRRKSVDDEVDPSEVVLSGKISSVRYTHSIENQEYFEMESSRGEPSDFVVIETNHSEVSTTRLTLLSLLH